MVFPGKPEAKVAERVEQRFSAALTTCPRRRLQPLRYLLCNFRRRCSYK